MNRTKTGERYKKSRRNRCAWQALWVLGLLFSFGFFTAAAQAVAAQSATERAAEEALTAVVLSDLHFTRKKEVSSIIVSGIAYAEEIVDAIVAEVIDLHPDVLILTGDNTNTGDIEDVKTLVRKLEKVKEAGITLVITTGNHDFDHSTAELFEEQYFPLLDCADKDASSLSYTVVINDTVFLAMDDNAVHPGREGEFFPETMVWLEQMLSKYEGCPIIFLSHHNVLAGKGSKTSSSYRILNEALAPLLERHGVRLAMTGHLHSQSILEENGLYEIINTMPLSGEHTFGILKVDKNSLFYHREKIDFAAFGSGTLARDLERKDVENFAYWKNAMKKTLQTGMATDARTDEMAELFMNFLGWYTEGTIADHLEQLLKDPLFEALVNALAKTNYGPWMKAIVNSTPMDATQLYIPLERAEKTEDEIH